MNRQQFDARLEQYQPGLQAAASRMTATCKGVPLGKCRRDLADELLSRANAQCIQSWETYDDSRDAFFAWALWRMRGELSHMRREFTAVRGGAFTVPKSIHEQSSRASDYDVGRTLESMLPDDRTIDPAAVIDLQTVTKFLESIPGGRELLEQANGSTEREIAGESVSRQAVNQRIARARAALKERFGEYAD